MEGAQLLQKYSKRGYGPDPGDSHADGADARELGGTLTAASEGPGKGATFALELPATGIFRAGDPPTTTVGDPRQGCAGRLIQVQDSTLQGSGGGLGTVVDF